MHNQRVIQWVPEILHWIDDLLREVNDPLQFIRLAPFSRVHIEEAIKKVVNQQSLVIESAQQQTPRCLVIFHC